MPLRRDASDASAETAVFRHGYAAESFLAPPRYRYALHCEATIPHRATEHGPRLHALKLAYTVRRRDQSTQESGCPCPLVALPPWSANPPQPLRHRRPAHPLPSRQCRPRFVHALVQHPLPRPRPLPRHRPSTPRRRNLPWSPPPRLQPHPGFSERSYRGGDVNAGRTLPHAQALDRPRRRRRSLAILCSKEAIHSSRCSSHSPASRYSMASRTICMAMSWSRNWCSWSFASSS
jgi:hypothetical protein